MKNLDKNLLILIIGLSLGISSCAPKYTAHFRNDPFYKGENLTQATMEQAPKEEVQLPEKQAPINEVQPIVVPEEAIAAEPTEPENEASQPEAVASKKNLIAKLGEIPSIKKLVTEHKENVKQLKESELDQKTLEKEIRKEEKRAQKAVKKQLFKEIKEVKKAKDKKAMNRKVYIGIIIGAAGIVIAILANGALGSILIIVGVGLIAWGLIEQGSV